MINLFKINIREVTAPLKNDAGEIGLINVDESRSMSTTFHKINTKMDLDLNVRSATLKLAKENIANVS